MERLTSLVCRALFIVAFILAAIAVWEKLVNFFGYTFMKIYGPWRLLEFAVVVLLFVIPLQLREIKYVLRGKRSNH
ncbi:MAG: hypothetical protein JRJ45_10605 [Deltaproteobacteria bacterium]|nr:hypothetical protein [Deltaproteobacteria bacterium]